MRHPLRLLPLVALLAAAMPVPPPPAFAQSTPLSLRDLLLRQGDLRIDGRTIDRAELVAFYQSRGFAPVWADAPDREAKLLHALAGAVEQGLDPASFEIPRDGEPERELLLSDAFLRYARALAQGRASSAHLETDWAFAAPVFDAGATLEKASSGDPAVLLAGLLPREPGYRQLQDALVRYRRIAASGGWAPLDAGAKLARGAAGEATRSLRRRLAAEGYLPPEAVAGDFDKTVESAVRRFQLHHGIAVDGEVGQATLDALNVSVTARIDQIRANLERWRELPRNWPKTRIEVNAPAATLTAIEAGEAKLVMRTIVGAEEHPTPVLEARMNAILFNPSWRIPASIAKNEILPRSRRDPRYLERNHFIRLGATLQQLPGEGNALGRLKFEMPNIYDVYLHDTPSHPLFNRIGRHLSHGCVRLENPRLLARYVLADRPGWGDAEIDEAITAGETRRVPLAHSRPVYLLYWTAFAAADGTLDFRDDIYDRDRRLLAALAGRDAEERLVPIAAVDQTANKLEAAASH
jgi:murein L,D-transpeptidase YcbB/YkuD